METVSTTWKLLDLHVHKSKQGNTTNLNVSFFPWKMKKELLTWDLNPRRTAHEADVRHIVYEADALPTELPKQHNWLGQYNILWQSINHS